MPVVKLTDYQLAAINNPFNHFAFFAGISVGKTYTGAHFAIKMIKDMPDVTGFIGANTFDQLSQATLRELFYWLTHYGFDYVSDRQPPPDWNVNLELKSYKNTLLVRDLKTFKVTLIFTRILSDADALRGIEFTWYWLDESRDTPRITHDVVLSRMRETKNFIKGLITTTTNGEDWTFERFVKNTTYKDMTYGSMHVRTYEAVKAGIITEQFYNTLLRSYSPMLALQELEAQHVNLLGGKAYYSFTDKNRKVISPWGDYVPSRERPLIVGCDFNFSPAPCVWMIGQLGPDSYSRSGKTYWGDCIHWFGEVSGLEISTEDLTIKLMNQYPDYFYRIFGDVSGGKGTTSNAGVTDYDTISNVLAENGCEFSIDYFQGTDKQNPKVKSRVENMNRVACNAVGEIRMTYNPNTCPYFDGDMKMVGWRPMALQEGRGKLSDGGDSNRTHASDGAGYAIYKIFPPTRMTKIVPSVQSSIRREHGLL